MMLTTTIMKHFPEKKRDKTDILCGQCQHFRFLYSFLPNKKDEKQYYKNSRKGYHPCESMLARSQLQF